MCYTHAAQTRARSEITNETFQRPQDIFSLNDLATKNKQINKQKSPP